MAYSAIVDWSTRLTLATQVKVSLTFQAVPLTEPTITDILAELNQSSLWGATAVENTTGWFASSNTIKVIGTIKQECSGAELIADVVNRINTWNVWSVQASLLETDIGFRPKDVFDALKPSTTTVLGLVAIAVIGVIGYLLLKKGGIV